MIYDYNESNKLICKKCRYLIPDLSKDRHGCYWSDLASQPLGMLAMMLRGQYREYNALEKRMAQSIWNSAKEKSRPKKIKKVPVFDATNQEIHEAWVRLGDEVFEPNF